MSRLLFYMLLRVGDVLKTPMVSISVSGLMTFLGVLICILVYRRIGWKSVLAFGSFYFIYFFITLFNMFLFDASVSSEFFTLQEANDFVKAAGTTASLGMTGSMIVVLYNLVGMIKLQDKTE